MLITLGQDPSPPAPSPFARGTHLQKFSPLGRVSITTRLWLQSSSLAESFLVSADAVLGLKAANVSLESGELSKREVCE